MRLKYITIEREYGAGGTLIAQELAKRCNINYFGHEILERLADEANLPIEDIEKYEEKASNGLLYSMYVVNQSTTGDPDLLSNEAKLFVGEASMIKKCALEGPAVFVGHSASEALKEDHKNILRVFIHAENKDKEKRLISQYHINPKNVKLQCKLHNRKREHYYNLTTHKKWRDFDNYDLLLNSSRLGIEGCVDVLEAIYNLQFENK